MKFDKLFNEMIAGLGGVYDGAGEADANELGGSDWYATGDAKVPKVLGAKERKGKKKKKKKDTDSGEPTPLILRRTSPNM